MAQKATIIIRQIGNAERTVSLSKKSLLDVIGALLGECDSIEDEIKNSKCIEEKSRLMADYQALVKTWKELDSLEEWL